MRRILIAAALGFGLILSGCAEGFDPMDKFADWDIMGSGKTPLQGDRREVFPSGVPGVPQGVPPELMKGYQQPAEAPPPVIEAKPVKGRQAQQKQQPKPKKTAAVRRQAPPPQQAEPEIEEDNSPPPPQRSQPVRGGGQMQQMPGSQPTWPSGAQPAPAR